jgi:HlyD family secretion protein
MASNPSSNRATPFAIWGLAIILVGLAVYAVRSLSRERITIHTAGVTYQDLVKSASTNGKVEPLDDFRAQAPAAGRVDEIYVDVGQKVKAGQLLVRMDDKYALANLAHAQFTLKAAELAVNDIERGGTQDERNTYASDLSRAQFQRQQDAVSLASLEKLQQQGAASPSEVAAAQHRIELDDTNIHTIQQRTTQRYGQADLASAQAQLADARAAVAAAQSAYDNVDIRTPISGTVYYLPVSENDYVSMDAPDLVYVGDLSRLRVTAYFDEPDIGSLAAGQQAEITWQAKEGELWHGHVSLAPTTIISYGTRNVGECFITVDDADGVLQPNSTVNVKVITAQRLHVLSVPREAVHTDGAGSFVFRVIGEKLVRTSIQAGLYNLTREEILSGLSAGDVVALAATTPHDLSDGLEVTPIP